MTGTAMAEEASGPPGGLAQLLETHRGELLRFLAARCGDTELAQDLLQELWIKAAGQPPGPIANGRAYLFRMANNLMLDNVRTRRRAMTRDRAWSQAQGYAETPLEDRPDPAPSADEAIARKQEAEILARAIGELPPGARRALHLYRVEDMSQAEVAQEMGISRSGVEKHLAVAMKHLRNSLRDWGFFAGMESQEQQIVRDGQARTGNRA
jgi:RNA polymerase sigma-70 factor (ECF subfamily)